MNLTLRNTKESGIVRLLLIAAAAVCGFSGRAGAYSFVGFNGGVPEDIPMSAGRMVATQFIAGSSFAAASMRIHIWGIRAGNVSMGIYASDGTGNGPGTLLGSTGSVSVLPDDNWNSAALGSTVSLTGGTAYWLTWNLSQDQNVFMDDTDPDSAKYKTQNFNNWPAAFGTPTGNFTSGKTEILATDSTSGPPSPTGSIQILDNNNSGYTNQTNPAISVTYQNATQMQFSLNSQDTGATLIPVASTYSGLDVSTGGQGTKTVWARFYNGSTYSPWISDVTVYDITAPTVTVNQAAGQPDPTNTLPVQFTVTFSEPATGFDKKDLTFGGTGTTVTDTSVSGSGAVYTAAAGAVNGSGTIIASIGAGKAFDLAGNGNAASTSTDNTVTFNNQAPQNSRIAIVDYNGFTSDPTPSCSLFVSDGDSVRITLDPLSNPPWKRFTAGMIDSTISLVGDGGKRIYAQFKNLAGNAGAWVSDSTTFDATVPASAITKPADNGRYNTASWPDTIRGTGSDNLSGIDFVRIRVRQMTNGRYWGGNAFNQTDTGAAWLPPTSGTTSWYLLLGDAALNNSEYVVETWCMDRAGNVQSLVTTLSFIFDKIAPSGVITIEDLDGYTNDLDPRLTVTSADADSMRIGLVGGDSSAWKPISAMSVPNDSLMATEEGVSIYWVRFKDLAGNTSSRFFDTTTIDVTPPTSAISTGGTWSQAGWNGISGTASDATSGVQSVRAQIRRNADGFTWTGSSWSGVPSWVDGTLSGTAWTYAITADNLGDGQYSISAVAVDRAGNSQPSAAAGSFTIDNTFGGTAQVAITKNGGFTNDPHPRLALSSSSASQMKIALAADTGTAAWKAFAPVDSINIGTGGDRGVRIWARFRDSLGNPSPWVSDTVFYDATPPLSTVSTRGIFNAASWPGGLSGTASDAASGVDSVHVQVRNTAANPNTYWNGSSWGTTAVWARATGTNSWSLTIGGAQMNDGRYSVQVRATDVAGNAQTTMGSGSFSYDNAPPGNVSVLVTDKDGYTSDTDPPLKLSASGADSMRFAVGFDTTAWRRFATSDSVPLGTGGDGLKRIWAQFRDTAGNHSPWTGDTTHLDRTAPVAVIATSGAFNAVSWRNVTGTASDGGSGIDTVLITVRNKTTGAYWDGSGWGTPEIWNRATGAASWSLAVPAASLMSETYVVAAKAKDKVGNIQQTPASGEFIFHLRPRAEFGPSALQTVSPGEVISFVDSSTGTVTSRVWNFGDGITATESNPQHAYQDAGRVFTVTLIVNGPGGSDTLRRDSLVYIMVENGNPIRLTGRYLSPTSVEVTYTSLDRIPSSSVPFVRMDSLLLWSGAGALPDDPQTAVRVEGYAISFLRQGDRLVYTDTVGVTELTAPDSTYGFIAVLKWSDGKLTEFGPINGTLVLMRDTTRVVNRLRLSAVYLGGDSVRVTIDSTHTLDTTTAGRVGLWYGFNDPANFSGAPTSWIKAGDVAAMSPYLRVIRDPLFAGEVRPLLVRAVLEGRNGVRGIDTSKTSVSVGRSRPQNTATLNAEAVGPDRIRLWWSGIGTADSIRIWIGTELVPVNVPGVPSTFSSLAPAVTSTQDTVTRLTPGTRYFFGLQIAKDGLWSVITQQSSATDMTEQGDTAGIVNTIRIVTSGFDSVTNLISITWTVPQETAGECEYGSVYGLGSFVDQPPARWEPVTDTLMTTILDLKSTIVFDTLYCLSLWLRRPAGVPARPGDSSMTTVRTPPSFTWQQIVYFDPGKRRDTVTAFNGSVLWWKDSTYQLNERTTDTLRAFVPEAGQLDGFVVVGTGFLVIGPESMPPIQVGLRYTAALVPPGVSARGIRIYRLSGSDWLVERGATIDTINRIVSIRTSELELPFIAMLDTVAPVIRIPQGVDAPIDPQTVSAIRDTVAVIDNCSNVRWQLLLSKGAERPALGDGGLLSARHDSVLTTVATLGIEDNGMRIWLLIDDGLYRDTIDLSRRGVRRRSDETSIEELDWHPLHVTADLDSVSAPSIFGPDWVYDSLDLRLFRWYPGVENASKPSKWVEYAPSRDSNFSFVPGRVIWIKTRQRQAVNFGRGITLSLTDTVRLKLPARQWSDIAVPYGFDMQLRDIIDATGPRSELLQFYTWVKRRLSDDDSGYVSQPYYSEAIQSLKEQRDSLQLASHPRVSYTVYNMGDSAVELRIPPIPVAMSTPPRAAPKAAAGGWSIRIDPSLGVDAPLTPVYCGFTPGSGAATTFPPAPSFSPVSVGISAGIAPGEPGAAAIAHRSAQGYAFQLTAVNSGGTGQRLRYRFGGGRAPEGMQAAMYDPARMRWETDSANLSVGAGEREYRWVVVGNNEYRAWFVAQMPQWKLALMGAYPNPFKGSMRIRYSVPYSGVKEIRFGIYDMLGRCHWAYTQHQPVPGMATVAWEARPGRRLAGAGMYVLRMTAVERGKTRVFKQRITYLPR